jgi:hypothetical protein
VPSIDTLLADHILQSGDHLVSANGKVRLEMQAADGNLVLYDKDGMVVWSSKTTKHGGATLSLQKSDGNLVIYDTSHKALWSSTPHKGATKAVLHDDCSFTVADDEGNVLWSLGTVCSSTSLTALV